MTFNYSLSKKFDEYELRYKLAVSYIFSLDEKIRRGIDFKSTYCANNDLDFLEYTLCEYSYIKKNQKKIGKYKYFITFTLKDNSKASEAEHFLRDTIVKRKDNLGITGFRYVKEHITTNFHMHGVLATTIPLRKNRFNLYEKKYGFVQIKTIKNGTELEVDNYLSKENEIICIV